MAGWGHAWALQAVQGAVLQFDGLPEVEIRQAILGDGGIDQPRRDVERRYRKLRKEMANA